MKYKIYFGVTLSFISLHGFSADKIDSSSAISSKVTHAGECVELFNNSVPDKYQTLLIQSFNYKGDLVKKPFLQLEKGAKTCTTFSKNGYYQLNYYDENKNLFQTYIAVLPIVSFSNENMGVVTHFGNLKKNSDPDIIFPMIKAAGISWIRDELYWQDIEKEKGTFTFPKKYDDYISSSNKDGIKALIVLNYGNRNYGGTQSIKNSIPPFLSYVENVVKRYGKFVNHWEVWNEPKPSLFGTASWEGYAKFLEQVYLKIKELQSDSVVIACGGGGAGGGPGGDCVKNIIKYKGAHIFDAFSIHPYLTKSPEIGYSSFNSPFKNFGGYVNADTVSRLLTSFDKNNLAKNGTKFPVYITEIGWPSSSKKSLNTDKLQASYAVRFYLLIKKYDIYPVVFWYDFRNDGTQAENQEHNFGLVRNDYSPKMSYVALATFNNVLAGYHWDKEIVNKNNVVINQYSRGKSIIQVGWTLDDEEHMANISSDTKKIIDWQGNELDINDSSWFLSPLPSYRKIR
ncbi:TPA: hypothetical protein L9Q88_005204 [Klebsiella pneumoniae]|nr:hypothetical protein [Klebsiella pneumoniae]MCD5718971.1 hypothetical protein [Klebsiella pneumoniae]MCP5600772.1 hypothetical protein [Klebsiella pneumoniae]HBR2890413.1 hypothetical protein [Klebsiella pneumoniae]HBS6221402.1 hypothetical protein [Klebsiella pneumoniae]